MDGKVHDREYRARIPGRVGMSDRFFTQNNCDRCGGDLQVRIMSWFNNDTLCMTCSDKETKLKAEMREAGMDPSKYEGCGYVPKVLVKQTA